jgi:hypothetical protein
MSLNYRQRHRLRLVKAGLRRSDPLLCAMFGMFGRLYRGEGMPAWEQLPTSSDHGRIVSWRVAVLAAVATVLSAVLTAALVAVTAIRRHQGRPPASRPEHARYDQEAGDHQGPAGRSGGGYGGY